MFIAIGIALALVGAVVIASIVVRAMPRVRKIRVPKRSRVHKREAALKDQIMLDRMTRRVRSVGDRIARRGRVVGQRAGATLERWYRRLRLLAHEHQSQRTVEATSCEDLIVEAKAAADGTDFDLAEERYLACLKVDAKHRGAYLGLAALYRMRKEQALAEETLRFLRKLYPADAEVMVAFATVLQERGKGAAALKEMQAALRVAPKNPRFLDFALELAIVERDRVLAGRLLDRMRETNPENQKLEEIGERIANLPR